jgi:glyoxylase-like metal-dependent hydrolase (beta-lactamase superfamily II)
MTEPLPAISRRHFLTTTAAAATAACLNPRTLLAQGFPAQQAPDFLTKSRAGNANNKITATPLRRNVTFLGGAGGNIVVRAAKEGKLHVGDTWFNGFYPFIDYSSGGNISGMIRATEQNLAATTADTIIIPGHGPIGNKAQLTEFHDMLVSVRDNVAKLKKEGKSLDETIAAKPTAAFDEKWGEKPGAFIGYVYQGV